MNAKSCTQLERAKVKLLTDPASRFLAGFVLPVRIDVSESIGTMATDGRRILVNESFMNGLSNDEIVFCLSHEAMHIVELHCDRKRIGERDVQLWNIAGDLSINTRLLRGDCGSVPNGAVVANHDGLWQHGKLSVVDCHLKTVEEIYQELVQTRDKDSGASENSLPGGPLSNDVSPADLSEEERGELQRRMLDAVNAAKLRGDGVGEMVAYYESFIRGRVDWRNELRGLSSPLMRSLETFARPNRRSSLLPPNHFLPGRKQDGIRVVFVIDTSGSIGADEIRYFLGEAVGLFKSYPAGAVELSIFFHDTESYGPFVVRSAAALKKLKIVGGGGTDHRPVIAAVEKLCPSMVVFLTDACSEFPDHWKIPRALWLITERRAMDRVTLPGKKVFVPLSDLKGGV